MKDRKFIIFIENNQNEDETWNTIVECFGDVNEESWDKFIDKKDIRNKNILNHIKNIDELNVNLCPSEQLFYYYDDKEGLPALCSYDEVIELISREDSNSYKPLYSVGTVKFYEQDDSSCPCSEDEDKDQSSPCCCEPEDLEYARYDFLIDSMYKGQCYNKSKI